MFHDLILLLGILAVTADFACVSLATVLVCARLEICGAAFSGRHGAPGCVQRCSRFWR